MKPRKLFNSISPVMSYRFHDFDVNMSYRFLCVELASASLIGGNHSLHVLLRVPDQLSQLPVGFQNFIKKINKMHS